MSQEKDGAIGSTQTGTARAMRGCEHERIGYVPNGVLRQMLEGCPLTPPNKTDRDIYNTFVDDFARSTRAGARPND